MVPFQTFLALLALLVLTSCSQTSPPHTEVEKLSQKEAAALNDSPSSTIPVAKPAVDGETNSDSPTTYETDSSVPGVTSFTVLGGAAQVMYDLLAIKPVKFSNNKHKYSVKRGAEFTCMLDNNTPSCTVTLTNSDGSAVEVISRNDVLPGTAKTALVKGNLANVNLIGVDETKTQEKWAKVWIIPEKDYYDSFNAHEDTLTPTIQGVTSESEKVGQNMYCDKQLPSGYYSCYVYMDVTNGSAARVSDARPVFDAK